LHASTADRAIQLAATGSNLGFLTWILIGGILVAAVICAVLRIKVATPRAATSTNQKVSETMPEDEENNDEGSQSGIPLMLSIVALVVAVLVAVLRFTSS
jgi:hypothetical protein